MGWWPGGHLVGEGGSCGTEDHLLLSQYQRKEQKGRREGLDQAGLTFPFLRTCKLRRPFSASPGRCSYGTPRLPSSSPVTAEHPQSRVRGPWKGAAGQAGRPCRACRCPACLAAPGRAQHDPLEMPEG